jgi:hypothetical protein
VNIPADRVVKYGSQQVLMLVTHEREDTPTTAITYP